MIVIRESLQYLSLGLLLLLLHLVFNKRALTAFLLERPAVLEDDDAGVPQLAGSKQ